MGLVRHLFLLCLSHLTFAQERYEFTHRQMGTLFRMILYTADSAQAHRASQAAFQRIDALNDILSDYKDDSEISLLSKTSGSGRWIPVSQELWQVLRISRRASRKSKGAFDSTVGPTVQLWRRFRRQLELPSPSALREAREKVGYRKIRYRTRKRAVCLTVPGMRLDAGGIGKGYAVDEALQVLQHHGIRSALVDGGGNLAIGAAPPGKIGWQILIGEMDKDTTYRKVVALRDCGVSTSGDQFQFVEIDGKRYSHILDPFTGLGLVDQCTVSVIARNGTEADWLSTAVSVLGPERGLTLIRRRKQAKGYLLQPTQSGVKVWTSANFRVVERTTGLETSKN